MDALNKCCFRNLKQIPSLFCSCGRPPNLEIVGSICKQFSEFCSSYIGLLVFTSIATSERKESQNKGKHLV